MTDGVVAIAMTLLVLPLVESSSEVDARHPFVGRDLTTSSASAYIGTMVVLSALTSAITTAVERRLGGANRIAWTWATTAVFGICALLSLVDAELGLFALLSLAALRVVEVRRRGRAPAAPG